MRLVFLIFSQSFLVCDLYFLSLAYFLYDRNNSGLFKFITHFYMFYYEIKSCDALFFFFFWESVVQGDKEKNENQWKVGYYLVLKFTARLILWHFFWVAMKWMHLNKDHLKEEGVGTYELNPKSHSSKICTPRF